jgi:hypothetical protein
MRIQIFLFLIILIGANAINAQTSAFTYQGKLTDASITANGIYDMEFALFDQPTIGTGVQFGSPIPKNDVVVTGGIFTVQLDFGPLPFVNSVIDKYLEIRVKRDAEATFTTLNPRQLISSTPNAIKAINSQSADFLTTNCDECVDDPKIASVASTKITGQFSDAQVADALTISGGTINNTIVGGTTPAAGSFTSLASTGSLTLNTSGGTDAIVTEDMIQRNSASLETFTFRNFSPGAFQLRVDNTASAATPTYSFTGDPDTGIFGSTDNSLDFATGGVSRMQVNNSGVNISGPLIVNDGGLADATIRESGLTRSSASLESFRFENTGTGSLHLLVEGFGNAPAPSYSFINDPDTGLYNDFDGQMGFSVDGNRRMFVNGLGLTVDDGLTVRGTLALVGANSSFTLQRPNSTTGSGTNFSIRGQSALQSSPAATGGTTSISGGGGAGSANGGDVNLSGGAPGSTGQAGRVLIGTSAATTREIVIGSATMDAITTGRIITGSVAQLRIESVDTTPDVSNLTVLVLTYPVDVTITNLTGGAAGQCVMLIADMPVTETAAINDSGNFKLNGNWFSGPDNTLTVCRYGAFWYESSRSAN